MKVTFDFKGFKETKAIGIAKHNRRDLSHIKGNIKVSTKIPGGIDVSKISENVIRTDNFKNVASLLNGRKVIGGIQKRTQEYTGFVISIGNVADGTLPKDKLKEFFSETDKWVREKFGEKYLLQSIEHWDEDLPKIKILMANIVDYEGNDPKKQGKVYLSSKHRFKYEDAKSINEIRSLAKKIQLDFHADVASHWGIDGVESPSKEFGERGTKTKAEYLKEKNNEATKEIDRLNDLQKALKSAVNKMLVDYKALEKSVDPKKWKELMQDLKKEKTLQQSKLEEFKKGKER